MRRCLLRFIPEPLSITALDFADVMDGVDECRGGGCGVKFSVRWWMEMRWRETDEFEGGEQTENGGRANIRISD